MKLKEQYLRRLYEKKLPSVGFRIDQVRLPNQKKSNRAYLNHPGAVGIIPFISKDKIIMVQQYRHPVKAVTWEIPAGKMDPPEKPLQTLKRELKEETGYTARKVKRIVSFWPTAAFANEIIHIYTAHGLTKGKRSLDSDEFLNCHVWPLKKAYHAIKTGKIKDSKTIIALLVYKMLI